jgi:amino acid transporter
MNGPAPGVELVGSAPVGPLDLKWEKKAEELEFEALGSVRSAAEKWGTTLTAILGLVSTVLVVKGAEDVTKLSSETKGAVALILAIALFSAFYAAYRAAQAAQGTPKNLAWPSGPSFRAWSREEALAAKQKLLESRWATGIAVFLMVTAIGLSWFGDRADTSGSTVLLTPASGRPMCGSLLTENGELKLEVGEEKKTLPDGPYDTVSPVGACPEAKADDGGS